MYKVIKESGNNANITLKNTETNAEVIIGRLSVEIMNKLELAGYTFGDADGEIKLKDKWELEVSEEIGKDLGRLAMKMTRPVRDQRKKVTTPKKSNKEIDAMDVLLGLASYN